MSTSKLRTKFLPFGTWVKCWNMMEPVDQNWLKAHFTALLRVGCMNGGLLTMGRKGLVLVLCGRKHINLSFQQNSCLVWASVYFSQQLLPQHLCSWQSNLRYCFLSEEMLEHIAKKLRKTTFWLLIRDWKRAEEVENAWNQLCQLYITNI